jgi:hypothetical protein
VTAAAIAAPAVRERPILFSAPMVRALLAGRKTQTRRLYKPRYQDPYEVMDETTDGKAWPFVMDEAGTYHFRESPYGVVGDRLWVKETFRLIDGETRYRATCAELSGETWKPSIFMRRAYSRLTLEVTGIRVERIQAIGHQDAINEGIVPGRIPADEYGPERIGWMVYPDDGKSILSTSPEREFEKLWDSINGERAPRSSNPWVWAVSFRVVSQ